MGEATRARFAGEKKRGLPSEWLNVAPGIYPWGLLGRAGVWFQNGGGRQGYSVNCLIILVVNLVA